MTPLESLIGKQNNTEDNPISRKKFLNPRMVRYQESTGSGFGVGVGVGDGDGKNIRYRKLNFRRVS